MVPSASLRFHLTARSGNSKTGPIPVSTSPADLCPQSCPFRDGGGCYASTGRLSLNWQAVTAGHRGAPWSEFLAQIAALPAGTLWRHNQAGDIQDPTTISGRTMLRNLVTANRGKKGFTFTHHRPRTAAAIQALKGATADGFTVNVSTESIADADRMVAHGLRAITVVPSTDDRRMWRSPDGHPVVTCPAQVRNDVTCDRCRLCQGRPQEVIIAFRAHGSGARRVDARLLQAAA